MYSMPDFGAMIEDKGRMSAYERALRTVIDHGDVVVDIGTGTGIAALLACKFGAARVYAIDPNPAIQVARDISKANGFNEKIIFFQKLSTEVTLPERVDVIVSDMRGVLPLEGMHIPSIIDARDRFLKPDGYQIPQRDTLYIAGLEVSDLYSKITRPWNDNPYDLDMRAGLKYAANSWGKGRAKLEQLLLAPQSLAVLDYTSIKQSNIDQGIQWDVGEPGTLHGYQVWFDTLLAEGISFSTGPHAPELIYGTPFFPLAEPVPVGPGDLVKVKFKARLIEDDYVWRWDTQVERQGKTVAYHRQNSLESVPLSRDQLRKRSDKYEPVLNEDGEIAKLILELMDKKVVLGDIATQLMERYPRRFSRWEEALTSAGKLAEKYT